MAKNRRRKRKQPTGIILVDKPVGPSSRGVVEAVEKTLGLRGLGHCGTLDPLASGLLVLVSGLASRLQERLTGHDKVYLAGIRLGVNSASHDAEGPLEEVSPVPAMPSRARIEEELEAFLGETEQLAPLHSAIKVKGERLFERARRGEEIEAPRRRIRIEAIELVRYEAPELEIAVTCGPGTYIRALARDLGQRLGTGAYLSSLRRTRSGLFRIEDAARADGVDLQDLKSIEEALRDFPRIDLRLVDWDDLKNGRPIRAADDQILHEDSLIWLDGRIVGRAHRLSERDFRLKRLILDPFEETSRSASGSGMMSRPPHGDPVHD